MDIQTLIQTFALAENSPIPEALGGDNWFRSILPRDFKPAVGVLGVVTTVQGSGESHPEIIDMYKVRMTLVLWAPENGWKQAWDAYASIRLWLHGAQNLVFGDPGTVKTCLEETLPQEIVDVDTRCAKLVAFYQLVVRDAVLSEVGQDFEPTVTVDGGQF